MSVCRMESMVRMQGRYHFDSVFGSFDEFERRYPNLIAALRTIIDLAGKAASGIDNATKQNGSNGIISDAIENPWMTGFSGAL